MRAAKLVRIIVLPSFATEDTTQKTLSPFARWAPSTNTLMLRTVSVKREWGASETAPKDVQDAVVPHFQANDIVQL